MIYLTFLPSNAGWAVSLLWGMMILPLGDALQNTMQNMVSRIAGINNEELSNRGIGMGAAMGYTIKSIAYQFKGNSNNVENKTVEPIVSRVVNRENNIESKSMPSVSYENYSKNIMDSKESSSIINNTNQQENINNIKNEVKENGGIKKAFHVGKEFMNLGMYMAEGKNFKNNNQSYVHKKIYNENSIGNKEKDEKRSETKKIRVIEEDDDNE